jgi:hypothetical protein
MRETLSLMVERHARKVIERLHILWRGWHRLRVLAS